MVINTPFNFITGKFRYCKCYQTLTRSPLKNMVYNSFKVFLKYIDEFSDYEYK